MFRYYESQDDCEGLFKEAGIVYIPESDESFKRQVFQCICNYTVLFCVSIILDRKVLYYILMHSKTRFANLPCILAKYLQENFIVL